MTVTVIGWDGLALAPAAAEAMARATLVTGPDRLLRELGLKDAVPYGEDLLGVLDGHLEHGEGSAAVLAEGDPGFFGVVRELRGHGLRPAVLPAVPLAARAFACAGLNWEDALVVAPEHAGQLGRVVNACRAHHKVGVLCAPGVGPGELARELAPTTPRALIVCEDLGGPAERVTHSRMGEATTRPWKDPDVVLVVDPLHRPQPRSWVAGPRPGPAEWALPGGGLPPEVRAFVLAKLGPRLGDLVWDVGSGSGEIAVECARLGAAVVAVERDEAACARIRRHVLDHGVKVALTRGNAPPALEPLPDPDAVYVGGGGPDVVVACAARRPRSLVCVVRAIEQVPAILDRMREYGYRAEGTQIQAAHFTVLPDGTHGLASAEPVLVLYGVPAHSE
ncbi:precorrin-6Y C5,15-methyltransferase (decarboxylating) subunit CbiT [Nonomuraea sp. NPDC050328]|uniref:precorrin-6Y C5,15-methyltransferase (decarboxylating) subunit CbiT n=1 Tax=Nonomuraea sp. NPDC050328 TaxID=3364361 RepID=UPI0037BD8154